MAIGAFQRTTKDLDLDPGARSRLERYLANTKAGYPVDLRTPFYAKAPREEIIDRARNEIGFTKFSELTAIDEKEISKIGPYSIRLPWKDREDSALAFLSQEWKPDMQALDLAVEYVKRLIPRGSLRPMDLSTAAEVMPRRTLLGLPRFSSDPNFIGEYLQRAYDAMSVDDIEPAVAGWRGQPNGLTEVPKQRLVWMMDHCETILALSILYPVLNVLRRLPGFSAWSSSDDVDLAITSLIERAIEAGVPIISADYKAFDASISGELLGVCFDVLRYWFYDSAVDRLTLLQSVDSTCGLVTPNGVMMGRTGGVPSGSGLTNLVDTVVNLIAGVYCSVRLDTRLIDYEVLGDDSVFVFSPSIDTTDIAVVMKELGLDCNPDKQFVSETGVHFLQRWHSHDYRIEGICRGIRSPYRALNGMCSLERWVPDKWNKWMITARLAMQVENTKWHPYFHNVVMFAKGGDAVLRSGVDLVEVFKRAGGSSAIRETLSIASYPFNVHDPAGVDGFRVTAELRGLNG